MNEKRTISPDEALQLLEDAKKQYAQYLEVSKPYDIAKLAKHEGGRSNAPTTSGPTRSILGSK